MGVARSHTFNLDGTGWSGRKSMTTNQTQNQRHGTKFRLALVVPALWLLDKLADEIVGRAVDMAMHVFFGP